MKPLLNPLIISAFIVTMLLGSLAHLCYGSCQTTKYHYMCQAYWMPENLPDWMLVYKAVKFKDHQFSYPLPSLYNGEWATWYESGVNESEENYEYGKLDGLSTFWNENGVKESVENYKDDKLDGLSTLWYNGAKAYEKNYKNGKLNGLSTSWNPDGTLNKKEYYAKEGNIQRYELFEKGKLVNKEYYDPKDNFLKRERFKKGKLVKTEKEQFPK